MSKKRTEIRQTSRNIRVVDAIYIQSKLECYRGNPLIEALPPPVSKTKWKERLQQQPAMMPEERTLPPELRVHCVLIMKRVFIVQVRYLEICEKADLLLRSAYVGVSLGESERRRRAQEWYACVQSGQVPDFGLGEQANGEFFSIIGSSGMGKTQALLHFLEWIPEVIRHTASQHLQIPVIYVQCPHNGSTKDFARSILRAFDRLLGTSFDKENERATEETLIAIAAALMDRYFVGLLVIDEIQNLSHKKSGGREEFMDFFLQLFNVLHLSIIVIGTMKAAGVLQTTFRQARRASSMGSVVWERSKPNDKGWTRLLNSLWQYQWQGEPTKLTDELADVLYDETQGITALLVRLLILVQHRAIALGVEELTPKLVRKVASDNLVLLRPMLAALRSGNPARIAKYDDFVIPELDEFAEISGAFPRESFSATESAEGAEAIKEDTRRTVLSMLLSLGLSEQVAEFHLKAVLDVTPEATPLEVMNEVLARTKGKSARKSTESRSKQKSEGAADLPSGYDELRDAGWLPPDGGLGATDEPGDAD